MLDCISFFIFIPFHLYFCHSHLLSGNLLQYAGQQQQQQFFSFEVMKTHKDDSLDDFLFVLFYAAPS